MIFNLEQKIKVTIGKIVILRHDVTRFIINVPVTKLHRTDVYIEKVYIIIYDQLYLHLYPF